ncbi:MAG: hypothetical protein ABIZ36_05150 [Gemmatimonadaceae bacterium]
MLQRDAVVADLRERRLLWESSPGVVGMRGELAELYSAVSSVIGEIARAEEVEEWRMPAAISFDVLERAKYFESFPHWLTAASHLREDESVLERVARAGHPGVEAAKSLELASASLPPAVCYHTYAALADSTIDVPLSMTAEETCWRHEGSRLAALERGWAFRMREIVFVGDVEEAELFRQNGIAEACAFAGSIGLQVRVEVAEDPFFAPTSRGRALLQRVKALKHELVVDRPSGEPLAIASFNNHERFFGEAFAIRLRDGDFATTACVAFGIERWVLAVLMTHGTDSTNWPGLGRALATGGAR